ncbi:peptidylprolyl isomerase [Hirschia litorea]|uniref:SurA N-terminal domain-containing protein n=1 Tax=Hirschia litorea TaxID=1199156 RepID=A0ABW2IHX8_9PROT
MLSIVRRMVRSKFMLVIFGLLVVGLAGMGLPNMFSSAEPRGLISSGDRFIVKRDAERRVDAYLNAVRENQGRTLTRQEAAQNGTVQQILQGLISETALLGFADQHNIRASRFAVTEMVANAPRFKNAVTGEFDEDAFRAFANQQGMTIKQLEKDLKDSFTREYVVNAVRTGVNVPNSLGKVWMTSQSEQRSFSYVKIAPDQVPVDLEVTDEDLQAFYDEHNAAFRQPERKAVSIISMSPSDFLSAVEIPEADLRDMYELRIKDFSSPEQRTITEFTSSNRRDVQQAIDEIGAGRDKEEVLSSISSLTTTSRSITSSDLTNEEFSRAVFAVSNGTHIGPFELEDDLWTGVIVEEITPGLAKPFEAVSDEIFQSMALIESEKIFDQKQEEFFDLIGGGFTFEEASDALEIPVMSYESIDTQGRNERGQVIGGIVYRPMAAQIINQMSFDGEVSEILDDVANGLYVIRLDEIQKSYVPELADIEELTKESLLAFRKSQAVESQAQKVLEKATEIKNLQNVAEDFDLKFVKPSTNLTRREIPEGISRAMAFQILGAAEGDYVLAPEQDGSISVIHIEKITNLDPEMLDLMSISGKRAISEGLETDIESAFVEAIIQESEVEFNNDAIAEFVTSMSGT